MEMFLSAASPRGVKSEVAVTERLPLRFAPVLDQKGLSRMATVQVLLSALMSKRLKTRIVFHTG